VEKTLDNREKECSASCGMAAVEVIVAPAD